MFVVAWNRSIKTSMKNIKKINQFKEFIKIGNNKKKKKK